MKASTVLFQISLFKVVHNSLVLPDSSDAKISGTCCEDQSRGRDSLEAETRNAHTVSAESVAEIATNEPATNEPETNEGALDSGN